MAAPQETLERSGRVSNWFEERLGARALFAALLHVRIPVAARTYYLGGITLFLFGIQVVTGTLLTLYYKPTPDTAYDSVKYITSVVEFGWLIRSVHHWAANLMIIFLVLHLVRIFVQGAYKYPRELTWVVGVGLLAATIGFGFTGYLLPWDQRAYWATVVGTDIAGGIPIIGPPLLELLRGGLDVTDATLGRFFGMHILVLPLMLAAFMVVHLTIVHQLGLANPKRPEPRPGRAATATTTAAAPTQVDASAGGGASADGGASAGGGASAVAVVSVEIDAKSADAPTQVDKLKPFFPDYVLDEVIAWAAMLAVLVVLASVLPAGLEGKADPLNTPHVKPEWYFLSVYQLLKIVPRDIGIITPVVAIAALALLPFLDRNPEVRPRRRSFLLLFAGVVAGLTVGLTVWGYYS